MIKQSIKMIYLFLVLVTVALTGCGGKEKENSSMKNEQSDIITEKLDDDTFDGEIDISELEDDEETTSATQQGNTWENPQNHAQDNNVELTEHTVTDEAPSQDSSDNNTKQPENDKQEEPSSQEMTKDSEGYYNNVVKP